MKGDEQMASTFGGLNIAGSGLRASNASLNTTANNGSTIVMYICPSTSCLNFP